MRKTLVVLTAAALLAGACSKKTGGGVKLKTDTDSVAYVIGMNVGMNLMKMDSTINVNAVCEGIRDVFRQGTPLKKHQSFIDAPHPGGTAPGHHQSRDVAHRHRMSLFRHSSLPFLLAGRLKNDQNPRICLFGLFSKEFSCPPLLSVMFPLTKPVRLFSHKFSRSPALKRYLSPMPSGALPPNP